MRLPRLALIGAGALPIMLAVLAAGAHAAAPQDQGWSTNLGSPTLLAGQAAALGFDAAGTQAIVGTYDTGATPDNDFVRVRFDDGNASVEIDDDVAKTTPGVPSTQQPFLGEGKRSVAVSRDGSYAVAGGNYEGTQANGPNVYVYALPDMKAVWTRSKAEPISSVAVEGGSLPTIVVAVGTRNGTGTAPGHITLFDGSGNQKWDRSVNTCTSNGIGGSVAALALSQDGRWLVAGTSFFVGNDPRGCVLLFDTASFNPVACYETQLASGTPDITAVSVSPNGAWYAAGTTGGRYLLFQNAPSSNGCPVASQPALGQLAAVHPIIAVKVASDGSSLVAADDVSVNRFLRAEDALNLNWSADVAGVKSLDVSADGAYIVAGAGNLTAFHRTSPQSIWSLEMANALVRIAQPQPNDVRIVAAAGSTVKGFRLNWAFDTLKGEPEPVAVAPNQTHSFPIQITNTGSGADTLDLTAAIRGAQGFLVSLNPVQLTLRPGESANTTVTLTPIGGASAQQYTFFVGIRGQISGYDAQVLVNATVGVVPGLSIAPQDPNSFRHGFLQGERAAIVLLVRNGGNGPLDVTFEANQNPNVGGPWPQVSFSRPTARIDAFGVSSTTLSLQVPQDARDGTENVINVSAKAEGLAATTEIQIVVNPILTVSLQAIPLSKVVTPGNSTTYTVVVANNGSLAETYRIIFCVALPNAIPCSGNATLGLGGWSVAVDQTPFTLNHDASRSFQLSVQAPRGALPKTDKLALQVEAISADPNLKFRDYKTIITSVVEAVPPTKAPAVTPGFEAPMLAAAAVGALALRKRR